MKTLHLTDDDLVLHYYGEMERPDEARAESHLEACPACRDNYGRLQRVMAFVDSAPAVDAPDGFERIAWARLEPALRSERRAWVRSVLLTPAYLLRPDRFVHRTGELIQDTHGRSPRRSIEVGQRFVDQSPTIIECVGHVIASTYELGL